MTAAIPAPLRGIPKAILFDAGNTLLQMNYAVIAAQLAARGHAVDAPAVQRGRAAGARPPRRGPRGAAQRPRRARPSTAATSATCSSTSASRKRPRSRRSRAGAAPTTCPGGSGTAPIPRRAAALAPREARGPRGGRHLELQRLGAVHPRGAGLAAHLDFVIDSSVVGVEKPDPRIFALGLRAARAWRAARGGLRGRSLLGRRAGRARGRARRHPARPGRLLGRRATAALARGPRRGGALCSARRVTAGYARASDYSGSVTKG